MTPINLAAFTNIANSSELKRLEISTEGTGIVAGAKAFSRGNTSRNMAVRQAFANALTSEFGRNAQIPLGFRAGRSPLSAKTVQKIVVNSQQAEAKAIKNVVMASLKRMGNLYPASLSNKDAKAALDKEMGTLLNKALEGKDAKQYLDPKKADHLVECMKSEIFQTKPELALAANILASGKVDAQWVNENREKLPELVRFYTKQDSIVVDIDAFTALCQNPVGSLNQMNLVREATPDFIRFLNDKGLINAMNGLDKANSEIEKCLISSIPKNATGVNNAQFNKALNLVIGSLKQVYNKGLNHRVNEVLQQSGYICPSTVMRTFFKALEQHMGRPSYMYTPEDIPALREFMFAHYPAMEASHMLNAELALPGAISGLPQEIQNIPEAARQDIVNQMLTNLKPQAYSSQDLHTLARQTVNNLPENDIKATLLKIFNSQDQHSAVKEFKEQLKEAVGLNANSYDTKNVQDIESSIGVMVKTVGYNLNSRVVQAMDNAMGAFLEANPTKMVFSADDMAQVKALMRERVQQNPPQISEESMQYLMNCLTH